MLLSIVIPTYNRAHLIEQTLRSVLNQTDRDFEVIIVDDGSTDHTEEVLKPFLGERVRYFKIPNSERGAARNYGTKQARGHYVNWFDSDDEMLPNHVAAIRKAVIEHDSPAILVFDYLNQFPENNSQTSSDIKPHVINKSKDILITGNFFSCNAVIVKNSIAQENLFNENRNLSASEDYELWLRMAAQYEIIGVDVVTSIIIHHPNRSVFTMTNAFQLENRFNTFLDLTTNSEKTRSFLNNHLNYFIMRNYLVLAVDLAFHKHKKKGLHYLIKAFKTHPGAVKQKVFWATCKHLLLKY